MGEGKEGRFTIVFGLRPDFGRDDLESLMDRIRDYKVGCLRYRVWGVIDRPDRLALVIHEDVKVMRFTDGYYVFELGFGKEIARFEADKIVEVVHSLFDE